MNGLNLVPTEVDIFQSIKQKQFIGNASESITLQLDSSQQSSIGYKHFENATDFIVAQVFMITVESGSGNDSKSSCIILAVAAAVLLMVDILASAWPVLL